MNIKQKTNYTLSKKVIALILAVIMFCSCFITVTSGAEEECATVSLPNIYLHGQGDDIYIDDESGEKKEIYPFDIDVKDLITTAYKNLHTPFHKALLTGDWSDWCDEFVSLAGSILEPIALDENGNIKDESYVRRLKTWKIQNSDKSYDFDAYQYYYDWRLDPCELADGLRSYIQQVKKACKVSKVNLMGRCIGADVVLAYLDKYGSDDLNTVVFYCSGFDGFEIVGNIYTGNINIDSDSLVRFTDNYLTDEDYSDDYLMASLADLVHILDSMGTLDVVIKILTDILDEVKDDVIPEILLKSFGTMPAFWSLIGDDYYEDAKEYVFDGQEEKYAGLITKIDNFHYNVLNNSESIIDKTINSGTKVYIAAKYGKQIIPITDNGKIQSDQILEVSSATMGATCSEITGTLGDKYISNAVNNGTQKYISADQQIDASTCYLPDHTWLIKDCTHLYMPESIDYFFAYLMNSDEWINATGCEEYPQFLRYDKSIDTISPLTTDNCDSNTEWNGNFISHYVSFNKNLWKYITKS